MDEATKVRVAQAINDHDGFYWDDYHGRWGAFTCGCGYPFVLDQTVTSEGRSALYAARTQHRLEAVLAALEE